MKKAILMLFLFCTNTLLWAGDQALMEDPQNYWQCSVYDGANQRWTAQSSYEKAAINKAFAACRKQSSLPKTCKAAKEYCDAIIHGANTRPMWRCTALDKAAKAWKSGIYRHKDDAALGAQAYCEEQSRVPESCYVHMLTCRNINPATLN